MNLQGITANIISAVNPMVDCILQVSNGKTTNADFSVSPAYLDAVAVSGQVQSLTFRDLQQIEGLNLQGIRKAIYLQGDVQGLVRQLNKGGDLITMPDGTVWLVAMVLESWGMNVLDTSGQWCKVAVTQQL